MRRFDKTILWLLAGISFFGAGSVLRAEVLTNEVFGMHIHGLARGVAWPPLPIGYLRLWDSGTKWRDLEPERGNWNFTTLDLYVDTAQKNGAKVLMTLGQPPAWAAARPDSESPYGPGASSEPRSMEDWKRYIETLARRYRGRIHAWELWNEVNVKHFYSGDFKTLVELERVAAEVLKSVDPSNILLTASIQGGAFKAFESYLAAGGGRYADAVAYHFYAVTANPEAIPERIERVRRIMSKYGLGSKPLWNTEVGWLIPNRDGRYKGEKPAWKKWARPDSEEGAGFVMRTILLNLAGGIRHVFWYSWDHGAMGLSEDRGRTPKLAAKAFVRLNGWLVGADFKGCEYKDDIWRCRLTRDGREQIIAWTGSRKPMPSEYRGRRSQRLADEAGTFGASSEEIGYIPVLIEVR